MTRALLLVLLLAPRLAPAAPAADPGLVTGTTTHYELAWRPTLGGVARQLMERIEAHHDRVYAALGVGDDAGVTRVFLLTDEPDMSAFVTARKGRRPPDWAAGLAFPRDREIYLHAHVPPDELDVTLQHEISHVALGVATWETRVPRWFTEGVAIRQSERFSFERIWLLTEAATLDVLLPLDELERGFPQSGARAGVAYAQAVHFVGYLEAEFGAERFRALIASMRDDGRSFDEAMAAVYPLSQDEIERQWRRSLRVWWGWLPIIFGSTSMWIFASLLLVLAWRRRKRQRAHRIRQMKAEEAVGLVERESPAPPRPRADGLHDPYDGRPPSIH